MEEGKEQFHHSMEGMRYWSGTNVLDKPQTSNFTFFMLSKFLSQLLGL
jgi:hypothetical protein